MSDLFKKIYFLSLLLSLIIFTLSCQRANTTSDSSITYFNDFETECDGSIWKNMRRSESALAFSGNYVCECPSDLLYAFGFDIEVNDTIGKANVLLAVDMKLKSASKLKSLFAISVERNGKILFWKSFPLSNGFTVENQWYHNAFSISLPNDVLKDSKINCYVMNGKNESFVIDDFSLDIKYFDLPTYLDDVKECDVPKDLKNIFNTKSVNILYSEKENQIVLADENDNA